MTQRGWRGGTLGFERRVVVGVIGVSVFFVGLVGSAGAHADFAAATPPARLLGSYATTLTGLEHFHGPGANRLTPGTPTTGKWVLTLSRARATLIQDGFRATNKVVYAGGQIKFAASTGCDVNLTPVTPGVYTYHFRGGRLRFREIHDSCVDRAAVLTEEPWHRR